MEGEKIALIDSMLPELEQETKTMRRLPEAIIQSVTSNLRSKVLTS
jgi:hypothetical protein